MSSRNSQEFWTYADKILNKTEVLKKSEWVRGYEKMIMAVKPHFTWTPSTLKHESNFKKSSAKSLKYAEDSIKAANKREEGRSLKLANMITAFAEDGGDLALGHLIRFQLLDLFEINFHQKIEELEACINSPESPKPLHASLKLVLKNGTNVSLNTNLEELNQLLQDFHAEKNLPHVKKFYQDAEKRNEEKRKFTRDLFTLKSPNPMAPALEDFVKIKYDSVKGRHLVVTKDVPVGTTLMVEKPFVTLLADVLDLEINRCHHCFRGSIIPVPCPNCVFALYCSEKCLEESKEYHSKYECSAFPDLHTVLSSEENNHLYLCAYAVVCTFGPHVLFRAFQEETEETEKSKEKISQTKSKDVGIPGVDPETGIYDASSFYTTTHIEQKNKKFQKTRDALIALALTRILETRTDFFQQLELELKSTSVKTEFQDFVTLTIARYYNTYGHHVTQEPQYFEDCDGPSSVWAIACAPVNKLTSPSCTLNVAVFETCNLKGLGVVEIAATDLKKGEELCRCYSTSFILDTKAQRQKHFKEYYYNFKCECVACLNDWPWAVLEAEKDSPRFCCSSCSLKIPPQPKMMKKTKYQKIALNSGNNFTCSQCQFEYEEKSLMSQFSNHSMNLGIAEKLTEKESHLDALNLLKAASSFFQHHLIPPTCYMVKCDELITIAIRRSVTGVYD